MTKHVDSGDPRHRPVVWASVDPLTADETSVGRRVAARLGLGLGGAAMVTALFLGVNLWSEAAPAAPTPGKPLWVAPGGEADAKPRLKETITARESTPTP